MLNNILCYFIKEIRHNKPLGQNRGVYVLY